MREIKLSPKQSLFVQSLLKGATYAAAYKKAGFPGGQHLNDNAAAGNAWRLLKKNDQVQGALAMAREELRQRAMLEACDIIEMLRETRAIAQAADPPQASAAVAAAMGIAKLLGLAVDKSESVVMHKPAPLPTTLVELSQDDWQRQFDPEHRPAPQLDFLD